MSTHPAIFLSFFTVNHEFKLPALVQIKLFSYPNKIPESKYVEKNISISTFQS